MGIKKNSKLENQELQQLKDFQSEIDKLTSKIVNLKSELDQYYNDYKEYARSQGLETSIFNFLNTEASRNYSPTIITFLRALEQQVKKTGIGDLELSLDFRPENIMLWNGSLVMIDW